MNSKRKKAISFDGKDVGRPPDDQPWCFYSLELLRSPAWRGQSINCRRLIEFLEIEYMQHNGYENGNLKATYDQLVDFGISRKLIHQSIVEAEERGLVEVMFGLYRGFARTNPTHFRLTFRRTREPDELGRTIWREPTHDWKRFIAKAESMVAKGELKQCPKGNSHSSQLGTDASVGVEKKRASARVLRDSRPVPKREPLSISRVDTGSCLARPDPGAHNTE